MQCVVVRGYQRRFECDACTTPSTSVAVLLHLACCRALHWQDAGSPLLASLCNTRDCFTRRKLEVRILQCYQPCTKCCRRDSSMRGMFVAYRQVQCAVLLYQALLETCCRHWGVQQSLRHKNLQGNTHAPSSALESQSTAGVNQCSSAWLPWELVVRTLTAAAVSTLLVTALTEPGQSPCW